MFRVQLENGHGFCARVSKMRMKFIRILPGDKTIQLSPYVSPAAGSCGDTSRRADMKCDHRSRRCAISARS